MSKPQNIAALKKRPEFLAVAAQGRKWVTPAFIIQLGASSDSPDCRVGLTASKKMIGGAVLRNRARRRLRALARDVFVRWPMAGQKIVLIARPDVLTRDYGVLRKDLEWALRKLGVTQP